MARAKRPVWRSLELLRQSFVPRPPTTIRTFITVSSPSKYPQKLRKAQQLKDALSLLRSPRRTIASSAPCNIKGEEAPSAQAYISSGILAGKKNLVDVKKVLVIGSGGLSIGQAGEFDYSGRSLWNVWRLYVAYFGACTDKVIS